MPLPLADADLGWAAERCDDHVVLLERASARSVTAAVAGPMPQLNEGLIRFILVKDTQFFSKYHVTPARLTD